MSGKYWNVENKGNVDQSNNAVEILTAKVLKKQTYYETCGPSSLESCLEVLGVNQERITGVLQPSDFYTMRLNDPRFISGTKYPGTPNNRVLDEYPKLIQELYGDVCTSKIHQLTTDIPKTIKLLKDIMVKPDTVTIVNTIDPGHYLSVHHIDSAGIVYYSDSWLGNTFNPAPKHKRTIDITTLAKNLKNYILEINLI